MATTMNGHLQAHKRYKWSGYDKCPTCGVSLADVDAWQSGGA